MRANSFLNPNFFWYSFPFQIVATVLLSFSPLSAQERQLRSIKSDLWCVGYILVQGPLELMYPPEDVKKLRQNVQNYLAEDFKKQPNRDTAKPDAIYAKVKKDLDLLKGTPEYFKACVKVAVSVLKRCERLNDSQQELVTCRRYVRSPFQDEFDVLNDALTKLGSTFYPAAFKPAERQKTD